MGPDTECLHVPTTSGYDNQFSELRSAGFKLKEVLPPALEGAARGSLRTRGAGLQRHEDMVPKGLFCLWMMTLNAGRDVSEYSLFLH